MIKGPKLIKEWVGGYVKTLRVIRNGLGEMQEGTIFKIESSGIRAHFVSLPCPCCGFKFRFSDKTKHKFDNMEWLGYNQPFHKDG